MSETYFIVLASNDRWVWSTAEIDTFVSRGGYRSPYEALDALRSNLSPRGLVVSQMIPNGVGFTVVADRPMFYAAAAMELIDDVKDRLDQRLRDLALQRAKDEGRTMVTADDIRATIEQFGATLLQELSLASQ